MDKRVRIESGRRRYTAEVRASAERVDVWQDVEWMGTWAWAGDQFGDRIAGRRRVPAEVMAALATKLGTVRA